MGENSNIEWTDHTFNPWRGCTKVSDGCKNCYAMTLSNRFDGKHGIWGPKGTRVIAAESAWKNPLKWDREAAKLGERHRVFCASMADVFEGPETMPEKAWTDVSVARERLGELIDQTPNLDWLILTKRPENVLKYGPLGMRWTQDPMPPNVWIGTSCEDQKTADERIPHLLKCPAAVRFLSCEPLLGSVDLSTWLGPYGSSIDYGQSVGYENMGNKIHWVIAGGESGPGRRPMELDWMRSIRNQCKAAGVAFFGKQWDKVQELPDDLKIQEFPEVSNASR